MHGGARHGHFGTPGLAAAAALGWGVDQAVKSERFIWDAEDISGLPHDDVTHAKFRKMMNDFQVRRGRTLDETGDAMLSAVRLNQGTPGGGIDNIPQFLDAADTEARRKRTGLNEAMTASLELAHQFGAYTPAAIQKLMATFAALSTADPRTLAGMTRAAGYAVPTLSRLGVDPTSVLLAGTALASAGVSSTKSGTWIREAVTRAMPGTSIMSKMIYKKHESALRQFGLVDENGKPTWYTDGKPDELKMFTIAGDAIQGMSPEDRAASGRALFGAQGTGAVAVLGDPVVNARMHAISDIAKSQAFIDRHSSYGKDSLDGSTLQDMRVAMSEFNVTTGELARITLPSLNVALGIFRSMLEGLRSVLPGSDGKSLATVGGHALVGATAGVATGALIGAFGGPIGMGAGAIIGGVAGGMEGVAEQYMKNNPGQVDRFGREVVVTGNSAAQAAEGMKALGDSIRGLKGAGGVFPGGTAPVPKVSLSINLDGRVIGQAVSSSMEKDSTFSTGAPAADAMDAYSAGDHHQMDH
jgi:hypothetical protein